MTFCRDLPSPVIVQEEAVATCVELHRMGDDEVVAVLAQLRASGGLVYVSAAVARGAPYFERSDERLEILRRRATYEDWFAAAGFAIASAEHLPERRRLFRRPSRHVVCAWVLKASG